MSGEACYQCVWRTTLSGSCHSACMNPIIKDLQNDPLQAVLSLFASVGRGLPTFNNENNPLNVRGTLHGINNGWFNWPHNFDPIWLENCDGILLMPNYCENCRDRISKAEDGLFVAGEGCNLKFKCIMNV